MCALVRVTCNISSADLQKALHRLRPGIQFGTWCALCTAPFELRRKAYTLLVMDTSVQLHILTGEKIRKNRLSFPAFQSEQSAIIEYLDKTVTEASIDDAIDRTRVKSTSSANTAPA